jgi:hypothetical protein
MLFCFRLVKARAILEQVVIKLVLAKKEQEINLEKKRENCLELVIKKLVVLAIWEMLVKKLVKVIVLPSLV